MQVQGRIQDFNFILEGGGNDYVRARIIMSAKPEVPDGSSVVLDALSCNLGIIFKHSDIKWGF